MKGFVGFGISAVALLIAAASQYATVRTVVEIDRHVAQTSAVLEETQAQLAALREVESASRGYAATGDERFIEQVRVGSKDARARLERLRRVTAGNPRELQIVTRLEANVLRLLSSAEEVIEAKREQGASAASDAIRESIRLKSMIETMNLIDWIKDEENTVLEVKVAEGRVAARQASVLTAVVTLLALGLIGMGLVNIRGRSLAEDALRKEQEFNAIALECLQDGIVTCGPAGESTRLNRAAQSMAAEPSLIPLARTLAGERVRSQELTLGSHVVLASGQPVFASSGEKLGAIVSLHEITDRKHAEDELRRSEARYRSVITSMAEGIVVQNAEGKIVASNLSANRILGLQEDQINGRFSTDPSWQAIREDGSPFPGEEHPSMVALKTNQSIRNVRMGLAKPNHQVTWLSINAEPIAEPPGVVATFIDITETKQNEDLLLEREAELREAQRLAEVGSWSWDIRTGIVRWSEELYRIMGYDPKLPVPPYADQEQFFTPASWTLLDEAVREILQTGKPYEITLHLSPQGTVKTVVARGEAVRGSDGRLIRLRGTAGRLK